MIVLELARDDTGKTWRWTGELVELPRVLVELAHEISWAGPGSLDGDALAEIDADAGL